MGFIRHKQTFNLAKSYDAVQTYFLAKYGSDSNSGLSEHKPFVTAAKALDVANAAASVSTPVTILCLDNGTYSIQSKSINDYVVFYAPNAKLIGNFIDIEGKSKIICAEQGEGFFDFVGATASDIAYYTARYVNGKFSPINTLRILSAASANISIGTLEMEVATGTPYGVLVDNASSIKNIIKIDTLLLGANNVGGINVDQGHATIIVGQTLKTGSFTGTTGIKVAAGATADIIIHGKNEADTPINVNDHNHNIISTEHGILIRGKRPLISAKGYASTQAARIETSFAEGSPSSPTTILPTADLGAHIAYGERQDGSLSGQYPYVELLPTTQAGDIEDGKYVITVNDVQSGGSVINHTAFSYAAKTGGGTGEYGVPFAVAGFSLPTADGVLGQLLQTNGSKVLGFVPKPVSIQFGIENLISSAPVIPRDNTPPLISEGTLISDGAPTPVTFTIPFTLSSLSKMLKISLSVVVWVDADVAVTVAVFESFGSSCIGKRSKKIKGTDSTNNLKSIEWTFFYQPPTTPSRTYTARIGPDATCNLRLNGDGSDTSLFINYSSFTIEEVPA